MSQPAVVTFCARICICAVHTQPRKLALRCTSRYIRLPPSRHEPCMDPTRQEYICPESSRSRTVETDYLFCVTLSPRPPPPLPPSYLNGLLHLHPVRDGDYGGIREARLVQAGEGQGPLSRSEVGVCLRQKLEQCFSLSCARAEKNKNRNEQN